MSEIRFNPIRKMFNIISIGRSKRLENFLRYGRNKRFDNIENCPFCRDNINHIDIYRINKANSSDWALRVIPNRFPLLRIEGELINEGYGYNDRISGIGADEIIIDSDRHDISLDDYKHAELQNLFRAFKDRYNDLNKDIRFRYLVGLKGIGIEAGALLKHSHSEIVALPIVPYAIIDVVKSYKKHYNEKGRCLCCDIIRDELKYKTRIICQNHSFVAISPYSSKPFEINIIPKRHTSSFAEIMYNEIDDLADIVREIYMRIAILLDKPATLFSIISSPLKCCRDDKYKIYQNLENYFHWYIELRPIVVRSSSFELATGLTVNPITPEESATYLREVTLR